MFKDQSFLTKISMNNRMPNLNKSFNKIGSTERHGRNIFVKYEKESYDHLPQIKEVRLINNETDSDQQINMLGDELRQRSSYLNKRSLSRINKFVSIDITAKQNEPFVKEDVIIVKDEELKAIKSIKKKVVASK